MKGYFVLPFFFFFLKELFHDILDREYSAASFAYFCSWKYFPLLFVNTK